LSGANLEGAKLSALEITDVDGKRTGRHWPANLSRAKLVGTIMTGCDLTMANLVGADLTGCDLAGANLTEARMTGCVLVGCNLAGAILPANFTQETEQKIAATG
jgi:uncharacterized protein YjbI with pentapeptide repeats